MKQTITYVFFLGWAVLGWSQKANFAEAALKETFLSTENKAVAFGDILKANSGKTILIKVWASWCKDCIADIPNVETLEKTHKAVVFLNLSLDKNFEAWKSGIERFHVHGQNYFINSGWKGSTFCEDIGLDWIPRYLVVNAKGKIALLKAIKANDPLIEEALKAVNF